MLRLENGRQLFYQWDLNQRLIVEDDAITQVHFSQFPMSTSLISEVFTENGVRLVNVPNVLLQQARTINAYAYLNEYTKSETQFNVVRKAKPDNYVYTEAEILRYENLESRIKELEENGVGGAGTAGADGKSAYQIWLDEGNAGNEASFLESLKGEKGDKGDAGADGKDGQCGKDGADGITPIKGTDYWTADDIESMVEEAVDELQKQNIFALSGHKHALSDITDYAPELPNYSTEEEKAVGIWVNGRTIYRKVFHWTVNPLPSNKWAYYEEQDLEDLNIDQYVDCKGMALCTSTNDANGVWQPIPRNVPDAVTQYSIGFGDLNGTRIGILFGTNYKTADIYFVADFVKNEAE